MTDTKTDKTPAGSQQPFGAAAKPETAQDFGMEEAANRGLLRQPNPGEPSRVAEVPGRPSFFGE